MAGKSLGLSTMITFHMIEPQRGEYRWTVKKNVDGKPFLVGEPTGVPLKTIGTAGQDLQVGFELAPRPKLNDAKAVVQLKNLRITQIVPF
jgi:hypothetical protein